MEQLRVSMCFYRRIGLLSRVDSRSWCMDERKRVTGLAEGGTGKREGTLQGEEGTRMGSRKGCILCTRQVETFSRQKR
jgi:hypothetical protein